MRWKAKLSAQMFAAAVWLLSLNACAFFPPSTPVLTETLQRPLALRQTTPASSKLISTAEPAALELGQPVWIGRGQIKDAVFLPGGKQVAIAWGSGVSLNQVETGQEVWFQPLSTNLIAFDAQPQGQMLAAALADGSLSLFGTLTGVSHRIEAAQPNAYWGDLAWSPDGQTLAVQFIGPARRDPIFLVDIASGQIRQLAGTEIEVSVQPVLAWSPDGSFLTVASLGDICSRVVDARTGTERMRLSRAGGCYGAYPLFWLPDGRLLAAGQNGVDVLEVPTGKPGPLLQGAGSIAEWQGVKRSLFIDPSGKWLAFRGGLNYYPINEQRPLTIWNLETSAVQAQLGQTVRALKPYRRITAAFDGRNILVMYENGAVTRWPFMDPQALETAVAQIPSMPVAAGSVRWSADGNRMAFTGRYGGVEVWETTAQKLARRFDPLLDTPALSPDGRWVALYDVRKGLEGIYDVGSGEALHLLPASRVLLGPAFSPDGQYLAYAKGPQVLITRLENATTVALKPVVGEGKGGQVVTRLIWSPDGKSLATLFGVPSPGSSGPGLILIWKLAEDGSFREVYRVSNCEASYVLPNLPLAIFNSSGSRVALQQLPVLEAGQMQLVVYDLAREKVTQTLPDYRLGAWVNADELLASKGRLVRIHVLSGEIKPGQGDDNNGNAYAPGGIFYMQASQTQPRGITLMHWQAGQNQIAGRGTFEPLNQSEYGWSPDGRWAASIGDDGTMRIWPVMMR